MSNGKSYLEEVFTELYKLRQDFGTEGIKTLLLVNGGAAVAVLAFLGSNPKAPISMWAIGGLLAYAAGVASVIPVQFYRAGE